MKRLAIQVLVVVGFVWLASCAAGFGIARAGGLGGVTALRDLGIIVLALLSLVTTLIVCVIFFGGAWAVGEFGPKGVGGLRWVGAKVARVEGATVNATERFVVRPLARTSRRAVSSTTLVRQLVSPSDRRTPWQNELSRWTTRINRRRGRSAV
jgi:hypothetical protein